MLHSVLLPSYMTGGTSSPGAARAAAAFARAPGTVSRSRKYCSACALACSPLSLFPRRCAVASLLRAEKSPTKLMMSPTGSA